MIDLSNSPANRVFHFFQEISNIPHGSGNTKQISDYCVNFAKQHNLEYYQDEWNNVIIIKEAAPGYENHRPYIIQGHLDMVCEKTNDCQIDFEKDGLDLYVEDGFIHARGTTLGADDGIAVAYGLALLEMEDLKTPRLEVVFTVDEETGMDGAQTIDLSVLKGTDWMNLDSEEEGVILCGCAGGLNASIEFPLQYKNTYGNRYQLKIYDLEGGHSGDKIDVGHGNPTLMIGRILQDLNRKYSIELISITGGKKGNVIPRESEVCFVGDSASRAGIEKTVQEWFETFKEEYVTVDPEIKFSLEVEIPDVHRCVRRSIFNKIITTLVLFPNDVITMSKEFPGHVESSSNAGICYMTEEKFYICAFMRSNVYSKKRMIADKVRCLAESLGGVYTESDDYPAWEYKMESTLRDTLSKVYKEIYNEEPRLDIIHAGLECGFFQGKLPGLDCVSFGPTIHDIHTPKERMEITSVERVWEFLLKILEHGNCC